MMVVKVPVSWVYNWWGFVTPSSLSSYLQDGKCAFILEILSWLWLSVSHLKQRFVKNTACKDGSC